MEATTAAIWVGTRAGLFRWRGGELVPIGGEGEPITALAALPGGRIAAGAADGRLLALERDGAVGERGSLPRGEAVVSLHHVPGSGSAAGALLVGTARGRLLVSGGPAARPVRSEQVVAGEPAALQVLGVPGRPRSVLVVGGGRGTWFVAEPDAKLEPWLRAPSPALLQAVPHDPDGHVWIGRSADRLWRSSDGARSFQPLAAWPQGVSPRFLHAAGPDRVLVLAHPRRDPPDPSDPSPLWLTADSGLGVHPVASRWIDRARDPSGEITAATSWRERDRVLFALGTDRGELLEWRVDAPSTLLADGLPPIDVLLAQSASSQVDPSTSGIHLLP
jgi:hypothetical protein